MMILIGMAPKAYRFEPLSRIGLIPRSHWSIPNEFHGFFCKVLIFVLDGVCVCFFFVVV